MGLEGCFADLVEDRAVDGLRAEMRSSWTETNSGFGQRLPLLTDVPCHPPCLLFAGVWWVQAATFDTVVFWKRFSFLYESDFGKVSMTIIDKSTATEPTTTFPRCSGTWFLGFLSC